MKAKEMFENLGYKQNVTTGIIEYRKVLTSIRFFYIIYT